MDLKYPRVKQYLDKNTSINYNVKLLSLSICYPLATSTIALLPNTVLAENFTQPTASLKYYNIGTGKLSDTLAEFSAHAGVQLVYQVNLLKGITSKGLTGR